MKSFKRWMAGFGLVTALTAGTGWAGSFSKDARGTSSAEFLKLPVSARAAALGGAVTAVSGDAAALAWNPAGLAQVEKRHAVLGHSPYVDGTSSSNGFFAQTLKNGAWGAGFSYFSAGDIDETAPGTGDVVGSFTPADWAGSLGYAHRLGGWSLGLAGKYVQSKIVESDSTLGLDGGILSPVFWQDRLRLGAGFRNAVGEIQLGSTARPLPFEASLGAALSPVKNWTLTGDLKFPRDNDPYAALGAEAIFSPLEKWRLAGRAGWNGGVDSDLGDLAGINLGLGVALNGIGIDYAFSPLGDLGDAHRFSLTLAF